MCRPSNSTAQTKTIKRTSSRLLLTHDSFLLEELDKDDKNKRALKDPWKLGLGGPNVWSTLLTIAFYIGLLFLLERLTRELISRFAHVHPILDVEVHRHILARHLAIDFVCLSIVGYLGVTHRHICNDLIRQGCSFGRSNSMSDDDYESRIFQYHPASQRLLMFFVIFQTKNMYDTIYWNDGPEFVAHHVLAGVAAWGGMFPGCCHYYALFFMGVSEISTAILCLLANFDEQHGVPGLSEVLPKTKIFLGILFVASFIICRVLMWPYVTYYFARDAMKAINSDSALAKSRKGYIRVITYACLGLSLIQVVFLAQIYIVGKEEIAKMMS